MTCLQRNLKLPFLYKVFYMHAFGDSQYSLFYNFLGHSHVPLWPTQKGDLSCLLYPKKSSFWTNNNITIQSSIHVVAAQCDFWVKKIIFLHADITRNNIH